MIKLEMKLLGPLLICKMKRLTSRIRLTAQHKKKSLELRARDRERKLMKKIENTLKKLDTDDFGYCDSCGVEIGIKRLEARPTADLCIDCKTLAEIREKQMVG